MIQLEKVIYTAKTHTSGGRENGASRSADGRLDIKISAPGGSGHGTNPEQLFAAGWSTCLISAIKLVAHKMKAPISDDVAVDAEVDLGPADGGYALAVRLNVSLPGVDRETALRVIKAAHEVCPYSRATHGNIDITTNVV